MPKRDKILITGSSGMLGIDLCRELSANYILSGTDIRSSEHNKEFLQDFAECDITKPGEIDGCIKNVSPKFIIHSAAMTDVDGCERDRDKAYAVNFLGTKHVALACKKYDAFPVCISTDFVFNGKKKSPYTEDDLTAPLSVYGDSKLKGEDAVRNALDKYFIVRTSWLYGKYGKNFVDTIASKAKTEKILKVVNDQCGSPTYTRDLAKAIRLLLDRVVSSVSGAAFYGIYHVSNSGSVSWYEYTRKIIDILGLKTEVRPISSIELARPAKRPSMSVLDTSKFTGLTGHNMRRWDVALEEYLSSERGE